MAPTLTSCPTTDYKHQSGTYCSGCLPPQQNELLHQPMHDSLTMWLRHEDFGSYFPTNFSDIDDLLVPKVADNINYSINYSPSMPLVTSFGMPEGDNGGHDQLSVLPELYNNGYSNCNTGYGGFGDPSCFDFGYFQLGDYNGEESHSCSAFGNYYHQRYYDALTTTQSLEFQSQLSAPACEENSTKVGRYSAEERRDRILRYLRKRNQRNFSKTIKYACRKSLADRRVRIRGRFAKNNEEESHTNNNNVSLTHQQIHHSLYTNANNKEEQHYDEEWLREAMSSFMFGSSLTSVASEKLFSCTS